MKRERGNIGLHRTSSRIILFFLIRDHDICNNNPRCLIIILGFAANYLITSSVRIAKYFKVSNLLIGLTVIAAGTSAPELFLSSMAALNGNGALSVGNVIGSNIFNLGFILGLSAILAPILSKRNLFIETVCFY
jgi:Ca2+/Na+ antiporter